jgi:hypothetical protein
VIVGVDGRIDGWHALEWAAAEASVRQSELHIVHVIRRPLVLDPGGAAPGFSLVARLPLGQAERVLEEAEQRTQRTAPDVRFVTSLELGSVPARLATDHGNSSLLVLGGGAGDAPGVLRRRSVTLRTVRRSRQPVVLVRLSPARVPGPSAGRVVIALGAGPSAAAALTEGLRAADARGVGVTVLYPRDRGDAVAGLLVDSDTLSADADVRLEAVTGSLPDALVSETSGAALAVVGLSAARLPSPRRLASESALLQGISVPVVAIGPKAARGRAPSYH